MRHVASTNKSENYFIAQKYLTNKSDKALLVVFKNMHQVLSISSDF